MDLPSALSARRVVSLREACTLTGWPRGTVLSAMRAAGWHDHGRVVCKVEGRIQTPRHLLSSPTETAHSDDKAYALWQEERRRLVGVGARYSEQLAALPPVVSLLDVRKVLRVSPGVAAAVLRENEWLEVGPSSARIDGVAHTTRVLFVRPAEVPWDSKAGLYRLWLGYKEKGLLPPDGVAPTPLGTLTVPDPSTTFAAENKAILDALPPVSSLADVKAALRASATCAAAVAKANGWIDAGLVTARFGARVQTAKRLFYRQGEVQEASKSDLYRLWLSYQKPKED